MLDLFALCSLCGPDIATNLSRISHMFRAKMVHNQRDTRFVFHALRSVWATAIHVRPQVFGLLSQATFRGPLAACCARCDRRRVPYHPAAEPHTVSRDAWDPVGKQFRTQATDLYP